MPVLYVAEVGYGNLGDDAPVDIVSRLLKVPVEAKPFAALTGNEAYDKVVIGSGTVLDLADSGWMKRLVSVAEKSKRTVLMCSGLDPGQPWSHGGVEAAQRLFARIGAKDRMVRGPVSQALLEVAGCGDSEVGLDPLVAYDPPGRSGGGRVLIVPGYQGRTTAGPHYHERMVSLGRECIKEGHAVEFHPVWLRDLDLAKAYSMEVEGSLLDYRGCGLDDLAGLMASSKAVVSNRMHGALLALICGTPALFISHHAKVQDMCLALEWPWYVDAGSPTLVQSVLEFLEAMPEPPIRRLAHYRRVVLTYFQKVRDG